MPRTASSRAIARVNRLKVKLLAIKVVDEWTAMARKLESMRPCLRDFRFGDIDGDGQVRLAQCFTPRGLSASDL